MASSMYSKVDEYGFERPESFDYKQYGNFLSQYIGVLAKRAKRWEDLKPTDRFKKTSTLKRFVRKGVPSSEREAVWMSISGAQEMQNESMVQYSSLKKYMENTTITEMIKIDIPRTFPDNIYFANDSILPEQLFNILATFAHHNKEVGYCQGLNYIAGLLLLVTKSEESSFWLLKVLVEQILPKYYIRSMSGLLIDLDVLDEFVQKNEPALHRHITRVGMPWAVASTKWFICLYAEVLPTETVLRIWDCIFYEGSKVIFRVALTLIKIHRQQILEARDLGEMVECFRKMGQNINVVNCHQFMIEVFKTPSSFSNRYLEKVREKHSALRST
ncbi:hypothetical protein PPYR_08819 [Photinus pyralis]|uniref:Growth hormone-regulated TBC protein 1 n=2 Tax=Photinus pyralis TaxID=7054 RepID=A0A1Y1NB13_PHOPY|nr:growth hormone-regulated TBC protein 1-A-like [Photinus pyralis]XP_031346004.1 growth hormone-regulated TBC protein 1-A-like [Photinus pyralis]KAB0797826.1 hypothetical protein PPYR_08819 [Photinus pyralis]